MRVLAPIAFLLILTIICRFQAPAQMCGNTFGHFVISNTEGEIIPNATIEILGALPEKENQRFWLKYAEPQQATKYLQVSPNFVNKVRKQAVLLEKNEDYCGNALKQQANVTEVKTPTDVTKKTNPNKTNFGYCTLETNLTNYLLKITAPDYVASYYIGNFLGGCYQRWDFVLSKDSKYKKQV